MKALQTVIVSLLFCLILAPLWALEKSSAPAFPDEAWVNRLLLRQAPKPQRLPLLKTVLPPASMMMIADQVINPLPGSPGIGSDFPTDPVDQPLPIDPSMPYPDYGGGMGGGGYGSGYGDPYSGYGGGLGSFGYYLKSGASDLLALEVLFQTLSFYGVTHVVEKKGTQVEFKVIKSKQGYLTDLTKVDVAYAIREFSRYFNALLCNQPTMGNFYKAFSQVPMEEIGLRFKYDMAWALLGNTLPREPNQIFLLGTRWKALQQIISSTTALRDSSTENKELKGIVANVSDVVNVLTRMNRVICMVDIRPEPKEELKKRVVAGKLLETKKRLVERYAAYKDILDQTTKANKSANSVTTPLGP